MEFTICIATYNRAHTINRTLDSLVNQTFKDFEVLVIDDGSSDNTQEKITSYKELLNLIYIKKENGGKSSALNVGFTRARGDFFIILDSDDWLVNDALGKMKKKWDEIQDKDAYCGIMGRCAYENGGLIGKPFPHENFISSYIDYHFGSGFKIGGYGDCCESIRTSLLKAYTYPIPKNTRFVPESYVMDQIGLNYKLLCTNEVYEIKEYLEDGMTINNLAHVQMNASGYIVGYVSRLEDIFPKTKISLDCKILSWYQYWNLLKYDKEQNAPRVKNVPFIGQLVRIVSVPMKIYFKIVSILKLFYTKS